MTCQLWRVVTSKKRQKPAILNKRPPSWILNLQSYSWPWRDPKNIWFCSKKHTKSKQAHKSKKLSSSYKQRGETWKKTEKRQKIVKIHFWVDGCYGNINHHRHSIDTGKFSLINFRERHEIWWLFVSPFKSYNSLKSPRAQCAPPPPGRIGLTSKS